MQTQIKVENSTNPNSLPIKVEKGANGEIVVSARELCQFLEIGTRFDTWIARMFEYGFVENVDYLEVTLKNEHNSLGGKSTSIDYALTLDTSKEIAMLQRSEKGQQARRYFLECEKQLQNPVIVIPSRNHNRLTQERLIAILTDIVKIEDKELRESLTSKLIGGAYGN